ncbi:MAG: peptidase T [Flavobacteriia bacterium]|nr:MAG: peptidase T [Flavobacteriia bacterium]
MPSPYQVAERFMRYVQIDTTSDPNSSTFPSTAKQRDLALVLFEELKALGLQDVEIDEWSYVFATIPSNVSQPLPTICFCSHMDTAPDCSGTNVKPILHTNYAGAPIVLPDDPRQVLRTEEHPYLLQKIGDDLITASGQTLLGADDKAGVAIIMELAAYLMAHPEVPHGPIRILFTPDEEVGRGVEQLDMQKLNAHFGYTLDGGPLGDIEDETFSADAATLTFHGVSAHPGYAKGKMVNAIKLASAFVDALPKTNWSPETTSHRDGFVHPTAIEGGLEKASVQLILRDHDTTLMESYPQKLEELAAQVVAAHPGARYEIKVQEQYRNMKEILAGVPFVADYAEEAMRKAGLQPKRAIIRGGTDGSRLSFMGLPCPNIFTGEMAIHSKLEYVSVQDMEKAIDTLVELVQIWKNHPWTQA